MLRRAGACLPIGSVMLPSLSFVHVDLLLLMVDSGVRVCFKDNFLNCARYISSNGRIILCDGLGRTRREAVVACFKLISQCLYVVT